MTNPDRDTEATSRAISEGLQLAVQSIFRDPLRPGESVGKVLLEAMARASGGSRASAAEDLGALVQSGLQAIASSVRCHANAVKELATVGDELVDELSRIGNALRDRCDQPITSPQRPTESSRDGDAQDVPPWLRGGASSP